MTNGRARITVTDRTTLGVTPEYILKARVAGLQNPSLDQIVNLRAQGIIE